MTEEGIDKKKIEFTPKEFEEVTKYLLGIRYQSVHVPQSGGLYYYIWLFCDVKGVEFYSLNYSSRKAVVIIDKNPVWLINFNNWRLFQAL